MNRMDFRESLGLLGLVSDEGFNNLVFRGFDMDGDGRISFAEYARGLSVMTKGTPDEKLVGR